MPKLFSLMLGTMMLGTLFSVLAKDSEVKTARPKQDVKKLPPRAFDLPQFTTRGFGDRYALGSNVAMVCSISPEITTGIDATIYHMKENGDLVLMSKFEFNTDSKGRAAFAFGPPFGEWRAGRAMVVIQPSLWPQMRETTELQFVGVNVNQEFVERPFAAASVVCDVSEDAELTTVVEPHQRFLVRGLLEVNDAKDAQFGPQFGPFVLVDLSVPKVDDAGAPQQLIYQSASTMSVRANDGRFGFEVELKAPEFPKNYVLKITPLVGSVVDARKSDNWVERIVSVKVVPRP